MQLLRSLLSQRRGFVAGFLSAVVLSGSVAYGASFVEKTISVVYQPLGFMFDGVRKTPPEDQKPFVYNGRTFVPLRFMAEALGKNVEYDGQTGMIYVGRRADVNRPGTPLLLTDGVFQRWTYVGNYNLVDYYWHGLDEHADVYGMAMENSYKIVGATRTWPPLQDDLDKTITLEKHWVLNGKYETLSGELFPTSSYTGFADGREVGYIMVRDENDKLLYTSPTVKATGANDHVPFRVNVHGVNKIQVQFVLVMNDNPLHTNDYTDMEGTSWRGARFTSLGVANFGLD